MQCLTFITDTDGRSGKVASRKARTVIRAHVMRKHWVDKSTSFRQKSYSVASRQTKVNEAVCSSSPVERIAIAEKTASPRRDQSSSGTAIPRGESSQGLFLTRHLTRVMDDFVYAGSSIDLQSYGHFQHYSSECMVHPSSVGSVPANMRLSQHHPTQLYPPFTTEESKCLMRDSHSAEFHSPAQSCLLHGSIP